jgi:(Z)-2-((N-methylformamido)methylene)-5-hydroxybutyrolactone dehydrogenase
MRVDQRKTEYKMFIGGEWREGSSGERLDSNNPADQTIWATIPQASDGDVRSAVAAARAALPGWRTLPGFKRAEYMNELARRLEADAARMGRVETIDNGKIIRETERQMHFAARNYRFYAGYADKIRGETIPLDNPNLFDYTLYEPVGVCALIIAWNSPMQLLANKLAPALAAGCTVVVKPSEQASASTLELAKMIAESGFPPGVVNVISGDHRAGTALTLAPGVDKISFTGGPATGRAILHNAAEHLVPVLLELGGKSPNIIFADADVPRAITGALAGIFAASGQTCIAGSRLLVERSIYAEVVRELAERASRIKLGDPLDPGTQMGPAANAGQFERIARYLEVGRREARLVTGGNKASGAAVDKGYFIQPTIFADVRNEMRIAQEEIFGPVLAILPFDDEDEAIAIANGTEYGLASGIWTQNLARAHRVAPQISAGTVWINTYRTSAAQAPFGGTKQSGFGRERGLHAISEYLAVKNVMIDLSDDARDPFTMSN